MPCAPRDPVSDQHLPFSETFSSDEGNFIPLPHLECEGADGSSIVVGSTRFGKQLTPSHNHEPLASALCDNVPGRQPAVIGGSYPFGQVPPGERSGPVDFADSPYLPPTASPRMPCKPARVGTASPIQSARVGTASPIQSARVGTASPIQSARVGTASSIQSARVGTASSIQSARVGTASPIQDRVGTAFPIQSARVGTASPIQSAHMGSASPIQSARVGSTSPIQSAHVGTASPIQSARVQTAASPTQFGPARATSLIEVGRPFQRPRRREVSPIDVGPPARVASLIDVAPSPASPVGIPQRKVLGSVVSLQCFSPASLDPDCMQQAYPLSPGLPEPGFGPTQSASRIYLDCGLDGAPFCGSQRTPHRASLTCYDHDETQGLSSPSMKAEDNSASQKVEEISAVQCNVPEPPLMANDDQPCSRPFFQSDRSPLNVRPSQSSSTHGSVGIRFQTMAEADPATLRRSTESANPLQKPSLFSYKDCSSRPEVSGPPCNFNAHGSKSGWVVPRLLQLWQSTRRSFGGAKQVPLFQGGFCHCRDAEEGPQTLLSIYYIPLTSFTPCTVV